MKTNTLLIQAALIASLAMAAVGCASKSDGGGGSTPDNSTTATPTPTPTPGTTGVDYWANEVGASVPLAIDSLAVMNTYVGTHPINAPSNIRLYVDLHDTGGGRWGGNVRIGYYDNGQLYTGAFSSENPTGAPYNRVSYHNWYVGLPNAEFNQWFSYGGKTVFHGFFQDSYGAIIIVIDGGIDLGDGGGVQDASGSVYFKNFTGAPGAQYQGGQGEQCWFLLPPSPYECGTFKIGEKVSTTSALYPGNGYTRLGTFSGLKKSRGFH